MGGATSSYNWATLFNDTLNLGAKKVQVGSSDKLICQKVSSTMWSYYPWQYTLVDNAPFTIPLVMGVQDYPRPNDCYRVVKGAVWVTSATPNLVYDFIGGISRTLPVNLQTRSARAITTMSDEPQLDIWRLEGAIDGSETCDLRVEYQPYMTPITDLGIQCWFLDEYAQTAQEGMLYWLYKYGEDERAGSATYTQSGSVEYSGQLAIWMGMLAQDAKNEDAGALTSIFPSEAFGENRCGSNNGAILLGS